MDKVDVGLLAACILYAPHLDKTAAGFFGGLLMVLGIILSIFYDKKP